MLFKSKFLRVSLALIVLLSLCVLAFADTVRLKDGSIVKGRVIGFRDGQFIILIGEGNRQRQMTFYADEIDAIEFDSAPVAANTTKVTNSSPNTTSTTTQPRPTPTPTPSMTPIPKSNDKVIVVGGNNDSNSNKTTPPENKSTNTQTVPVSNSNTKTNAQGVTLTAKVLADNTSNGWTNTGWVVKKGQRIRISGTGRIALGNGRYSTPSGVSSLPDNDKLIKAKPTGGLIAVIGDDNNDFIFIGGSAEFVATRDGALFLGVNEGFLDDNSGSFDVVVEIDPMASNGN
ncbi:MAG TPA: LecA/PA-IL family lectin [Pyrinomonadaceae bacterium]|nr:LecA/PA-IL family lectin [Pyrinomonadaceae bacterium]